MSMRSCKVLESEKDMISSLPDAVIDKILVRLPLGETINTSLLSKHWRHKWRIMSEVIINYSFSFSNSRNFPTKVNRFLLLHKGNIQRFQYDGSDRYYEDVNIWLDHLDSAHVQQLELTMDTDYVVPSCVFSFEKMVTLKLDMGKILLPSSFAGFQSLTTFSFRHIKLDEIGYKKLQELIHLCPLLKHLKLVVSFVNPTTSTFELNAPNLCSLDFDGPFASLRIKNTPLITNACLSSQSMFIQCHLQDLLHSLTNVVCLKIEGHLLFGRNSFNRSSMRKIKFKLLKKLHFVVNLNYYYQCSIALCIMMNSRALVYLNITQPPSFRHIWESKHHNISFKFRHLKFFEMDIAFGSKSEMRFIEFILGNASLLKVSDLKWASHCTLGIEEKMDILKKLLLVKRASTSVEVRFK